MKSIRELELEDKTVLVRVDYNVPIKNGKIESDQRIRASLPTLEYLREAGAGKIVLISHLGRPEGKYNSKLSLKPVAERLNKLIGRVSFIPAVSGEKVAAAVSSARGGEILVLENLRFSPGEEENDPEYIKEIIEAVEPDYYILDGFAAMHRKHASVDAVKSFMPVASGLLLEHEIESLSRVLDNPARPFLLILGGAKVEDKEPLIEKFAPIADQIFVGGKIAAEGYKSKYKNVYVAEDFDIDEAGAKKDIGPVSTAKLAGLITDAATILWNGLLGEAEDPAYATASTIAAELIGEKQAATTIIAGGDTVGFVESLAEEHESLDYTLLSTGGGATLEYLVNGTLVGLE